MIYLATFGCGLQVDCLRIPTAKDSMLDYYFVLFVCLAHCGTGFCDIMKNVFSLRIFCHHVEQS